MDQLTAIQTFVRVVASGNFSIAARDLNTTQATISKRISSLEKRLGTQLLARTSRNMTLTESGQQYLKRCLRIVSELEEAEDEIRTNKTQPKGILKVTAPVPFARLVLATIMPKFANKHPDIEVEVIVTDKLINIDDEDIDIAIRASQTSPADKHLIPVYDNPIIFAAAPKYLERYDMPQNPNELANHNCIIDFNFPNPYVWVLKDETEEYAVNISGNMRSNNGDYNLKLAEQGFGIVALPTWMLSTSFKKGTLTRILCDYCGFSMPITLVHPKTNYMPLKTKCFIDFMTKYFEEFEKSHERFNVQNRTSYSATPPL